VGVIFELRALGGLPWPAGLGKHGGAYERLEQDMRELLGADRMWDPVAAIDLTSASGGLGDPRAVADLSVGVVGRGPGAELERENRELRKVNEILRTARGFFAAAEVDRRLR